MWTVAQVAAEWQLADDFKDPARWLTDQIKAGRIRGRKIGRHWYMADADVKDPFYAFTPAPAPELELPRIGQPSRASMKRRVTA